MKKEIIKISDLLNSGKKVARLRGNRELDPKIVKKKKESLKQFGLLSPAIIIDGNKSIEEDLEIIDFETDEDISKEDAGQYIVLVEGNHRYKAHLELLEANVKLEEEQKYKKEFFVVYPLGDNMSIMEMLAEINICTNNWDTKDKVKSIAIKEDCPKLLLEINKLTNKGYSLNAASLWLTFSTKINTSVIHVAMQGKYLDPLKNEVGLERGLKILEVAKAKFGEKLCKSRTTLSGWIVNKYDNMLDKEKATFTDDMIQFISSIDSDNVTYLQKVKGEKGGSSKEELINKKLNELWDSFKVSVKSAE